MLERSRQGENYSDEGEVNQITPLMSARTRRSPAKGMALRADRAAGSSRLGLLGRGSQPVELVGPSQLQPPEYVYLVSGYPGSTLPASLIGTTAPL